MIQDMNMKPSIYRLHDSLDRSPWAYDHDTDCIGHLTEPTQEYLMWRPAVLHSRSVSLASRPPLLHAAPGASLGQVPCCCCCCLSRCVPKLDSLELRSNQPKGPRHAGEQHEQRTREGDHKQSSGGSHRRHWLRTAACMRNAGGASAFCCPCCASGP